MSGQEHSLALVVRAVDKASGPLRALTAKFNTITAPFKGLGKDWDAFSKAANLGGIVEGFKGVGGALRNVGAETFALGAKLATMAAGAGFALFSVVHGAMEAGDQLATMADRVGLTVDAYASLRHAADLADVEQETFNASMDKFNKNMGLMTVGSGGEFLKFLNEVSPALAREMKAAHGTEQALSILTDAFKRIDDPAKSAALSAAAFGKSGLQMGRFLHQGSAAIQAQQVEYMRLTGSQQKFAEGADELDSTTKQTVLAFTGLRNVVAGALFPALTTLSKAVTEFLVKNRDGLKKWAEGAGAALQAWLDGGGFDRLVTSLGNVATSIGKVVDFLGPMGTALAGGAYLAGPLILSLGSLGASLATLALTAFPSVMAGLSIVVPAFAGFAASAWAAVAPFAPFIAAAAGLALAGKAIYDNWDALAFIFKDWGNSLKWAVLDAWDVVKPIVDKITKAFSFLNSPAGFGGGALFFGSSDAQVARPSFNADAARPVVAPVQGTEAKVSVDFVNMPRGTRVSADPTSSAPVDLSLGYAMAAP